jgi:uncharacterized protein (UPF0335 family)
MHIGENIIKHWKYYAVMAALVSVGGWLYTQGGNDNVIESRLFSSPKIKYDTETYMEQRPSPEQEQRKILRDSANKVQAMKSRAFRDSTYKAEIKARKLETEARKKTDSIALLNADQLFQIKELLKQQ